MKNDEGWRMNDEGWWFQSVEGFLWLTDERTDICECRVAFATEKWVLYQLFLVLIVCQTFDPMYNYCLTGITSYHNCRYNFVYHWVGVWPPPPMWSVQYIPPPPGPSLGQLSSVWCPISRHSVYKKMLSNSFIVTTSPILTSYNRSGGDQTVIYENTRYDSNNTASRTLRRSFSVGR